MELIYNKILENLNTGQEFRAQQHIESRAAKQHTHQPYRRAQNPSRQYQRKGQQNSGCRKNVKQSGCYRFRHRLLTFLS